ncbi:MAG: ABC transporter permease [Albidovulum sp.]
MFYVKQRQSGFSSAFVILALIYHCAVQSVRRGNRNALMAILVNIFQTIFLICAFFLMFTILGMRGSSIRGNFVVYLMSGIFLYMSHVKTMSAVARSGGPTSPMMKHAPMNTAISIASSALGSLYTQLLSLVVVLLLYHVAIEHIYVEDPIGALGMFLLAWLAGVAVGMVFLAITPWSPGIAAMLTSIYMRANMIASGKMFVANSLTYTMLKMFDWNPLFHIIDQARGFSFINYYPHNSSVSYPVYVTIVLIMIGLLGEYYTRRRASISWDASR